MMKFLVTFYLALATSFVAVVTASNSTNTIQFPRIYVAEINTPAGKEPSAVSRFPAEVDLLDYDRITDKIHKISFLVHDEQELVYLVALAKKTKSKTINGTIALDLSATEKLRLQITTAVDGDKGLFSDIAPQAASVYSTLQIIPATRIFKAPSLGWMTWY
jgi:hypothetical protein